MNRYLRYVLVLFALQAAIFLKAEGAIQTEHAFLNSGVGGAIIEDSYEGETITQQEPTPDQNGKIKVTVIRSVGSETIKLLITFPKEADPMRIGLHNLLGRQISTIPEQSAPRGESIFQFDTRDLPNGHYFVVLEALGQRITKKVMINR